MKILTGHSLGGAAVLAVAERIPDATGGATLNAPRDPEHVQLRLRVVGQVKTRAMVSSPMSC